MRKPRYFSTEKLFSIPTISIENKNFKLIGIVTKKAYIKLINNKRVEVT